MGGIVPEGGGKGRCNEDKTHRKPKVESLRLPNNVNNDDDDDDDDDDHDDDDDDDDDHDDDDLDKRICLCLFHVPFWVG